MAEVSAAPGLSKPKRRASFFGALKKPFTKATSTDASTVKDGGSKPPEALEVTENYILKLSQDSSKEEGDQLAQALLVLVTGSGKLHTQIVPLHSHSIEAPPEGVTSLAGQSLLGGMVGSDTINKILASRKMGTFVIKNRATGEQEFEPMPIFTRLGMHIVFVHVPKGILTSSFVQKLFKDLSIKQGRLYDTVDPKLVAANIESFIQTYSISMADVLEQDYKNYKTFNAFFARSLKPEARPIASPDDPTIITSVADCRLTVFESVADAKKFWVKGREFSVAALLDDAGVAKKFGKASLAIFRLAPQDYHRYHAFADVELGKLIHLPGQYYTVNPQAINEDLDVFTANRRDIFMLNAKLSKDDSAPRTTFAFVAIGALLVGSVNWSKLPGDSADKGGDLGWFQYGGSTCILVAPQGSILFDSDLLETSRRGIEVCVKMGERIGRSAVS